MPAVRGTRGILGVGKLQLGSGAILGFYGTGAPVNGTSGTGAGLATPGSQYLRTSNGATYVNTNTKASPTWTQLGTTAALASGHLLVGSAGGAATDVAVSGDVTLVASGVFAVVPDIMVRATVALSAVNLAAMNVTPVNVVAAPGAGKAIVDFSVLFEMTRTGTAYANGGAVSFVYTGGAVPAAQGAVPATVVTTGGAGTVQSYLGPPVDANGTVVPANVGVDITNATAPFITGTGTAKALVKYRVVTL